MSPRFLAAPDRSIFRLKGVQDGECVAAGGLFILLLTPRCPKLCWVGANRRHVGGFWDLTGDSRVGGLGRPVARTRVAVQVPACFLASALPPLAPVSLKQGDSCSSEQGEGGEREGGRSREQGGFVGKGRWQPNNGWGTGERAPRLQTEPQTSPVPALVLLVCVFLGSIQSIPSPPRLLPSSKDPGNKCDRVIAASLALFVRARLAFGAGVYKETTSECVK